MRTIIIIKHCDFLFEPTDEIIAVERGALDAIKHGINVSFAVGDFDSVTREEYELIQEKMEVVKLNSEKDETDLFCALSLASNEKVIVLGGIEGRRVDHFLANINLFNKYHHLELKDDYTHIYSLEKGEYVFSLEENYVSFYSLSDKSIISLIGFKYPLDKYNLLRFDNLCISNEVKKGKLVLESGYLLVIISKQGA